jgi:SAM-dependent methyltransferase
VRESDARLNPAAVPESMPQSVEGPRPLPGAGLPAPAGASASADAEYLAFEDIFYDAAVVDEKMAGYIPRLTQVAKTLPPDLPFLDVGCGRGELLGHMREAGLACVGVETNALECEQLREQGFEVHNTDALSYLRGLKDSSLAGVTAIQVIEHLEPDYLLAMIEAMGAKVRAGGLVVIETPNSKCLSVHGTFYLDVSHRRLYPIETVAFHLARSGFGSLRSEYLMPCPVAYRVPDLPEANYTDYVLLANR